MQSDECWEEGDNHASLSTAIILLTQPRIFAACAHWWLPASSLWTRTWLMSHKSRIFSGKFFPSLYGCKDFRLLNCTIDFVHKSCAGPWFLLTPFMQPTYVSLDGSPILGCLTVPSLVSFENFMNKHSVTSCVSLIEMLKGTGPRTVPRFWYSICHTQSGSV